MPSAEKEVARSMYEAIESRDIDRLLELVTPDFEMHMSGEFLGNAAVYRGRDGYARFWRDWLDVWREFRFAVEEMRDCRDSILVLYWLEGAAHDGPRVRRRGGEILRFRDGACARVDAYSDWDSAIAAAGG